MFKRISNATYSGSPIETNRVIILRSRGYKGIEITL